MENQNISIFNPKDKLKEQVCEPKVIFKIYPPYSKKDEVKSAGATWLATTKYWYVLNPDNELYQLYKRRDLLNIYELKELYKKNDGKWDVNSKNWYTYNSNDQLKEYFL